MPYQARVDGSTGPTFVGPIQPDYADCGDSWCDTSRIPYPLKVYNCNNGTWEIISYYPGEGITGIAGYSFGSSYGTTAITDKLLFVNDSVGTISSVLTGRSNSGGGCNSMEGGYCIGGLNLSSLGSTNIYKIQFSDDSLSVLASTTDDGKAYVAGCESGSAGYVMGVGTTVGTSVEKLFFSDETTATTSAVLSVYREDGSGCNSYASGYDIGGDSSGPTVRTTTDRLTFSVDIMTSILSTISPGVTHASALESPSAGYNTGGARTLSGSTMIDRLLFAGEVISSLSSGLSGPWQWAGNYNSYVAGYIAGGRSTLFPNGSTNVDKLSFDSESISVVVSTLAVLVDGNTGFENLS